MLWQDWVFTIGGFIFIFALIPTIKGKNKPALSTSVSTAIILYLYVFTFFTLQLWLSTISTFFVGVAWTILAFQKYRQIKK